MCKAQAEAVEVAIGAPIVAVRHTAPPGGVDPTAATVHMGRARSRSSGVGLSIRTVAAVPVLARLKHIAAHVVEAKLVGLLGGNSVSAVVGTATAHMISIFIIPSHFFYYITSLVSGINYQNLNWPSFSGSNLELSICLNNSDRGILSKRTSPTA